MKTLSTQHVCIPCAIYQNINFHCMNIMSREKNVRFLIMIFISFYLIKILCCTVCLLLYWFVDLTVLFAQALIMLIRTSLGLFSASNLYFYQIISHGDQGTPKISLHTASSFSNSELWQLFYSAELFGNFKFCSLFAGPFVTPIMHSRLNVKARKRFNLLTIATDLL